MSKFGRGFATLAAGNLLGKAVAIGREVVFAGAFGSGPIASGFRVAQTASMVPANLIAGDLLSAAFAPSYSRQVKEGKGCDRRTLTAYSLWLSVILVLIAAIVFLAREPIVSTIVPGIDELSKTAATEFLGVLCWAIPLYGISSVHSLALATHGRYITTSVRPIIQSVGLLVGTAAAIVTGWVPWLACGFIAAWCVYSGICISLLVKNKKFGSIGHRDLSSTWRVFAGGLRGIAPLVPLPIFMQLSIILERSFSSYGDKGLIAAVDYARTVSDSVMSVVAVPLGLLGLTSLAGLPSRSYRRRVAGLTEIVVIFVLPASGVLFLVADPVVKLLFQRGQFDDVARHLTVSVLIGHLVGLVFQVLGYALSRALTASGRNRIVLVVTLVALFVQMAVQGLGIVFVGPLAIGLGPSAFGLVLTIGFALALGVFGRFVFCLVCLLPTVALTALLHILQPDVLWAVACLFIGASLNVLLIRPLRKRVARHSRPLLSVLRRREEGDFQSEERDHENELR